MAHVYKSLNQIQMPEEMVARAFWNRIFDLILEGRVKTKAQLYNILSFTTGHMGQVARSRLIAHPYHRVMRFFLD